MSLFVRHTRFTLLTVLIILAVLFLLLFSEPSATRSWRLSDAGLSAKLERSHKIYENLLKDRQELIKKFGPHPKDIVKWVNA